MISLSSIAVFGQTSELNTDTNLIFTQKFKFEVDTYYPLKKIKIAANGSLPNDQIDFGDSFGMGDRELTLNFKFGWRFSKKWMLSAEYFKLKSENGATLDKDINWNDITFREGSYVKAGVGMGIYRVFFGRIIKNKATNFEFGVGIGVHVLSTDAFLEGEAYINDIAIGVNKSGLDLVLPLPNVGIWAIYAPTHKWSISANIDWFGIRIDQYSGLLWDIAPKVSFEITKNFGLDLSYKYIQITARDKNTNWNGKLNVSFQGPTFGIHGKF